MKNKYSSLPIPEARSSESACKYKAGRIALEERL